MKRHLPYGSVAMVCIVAVLIPTGLYTLIGSANIRFLERLHYLVSTVYAITSVMVIVEAWAAYRRRPARVGRDRVPTLEVPDCTAIVAAYLPNEQQIILQTVRHLLDNLAAPAERLQVILAYNSPDVLPVEATLRRLAEEDARFTLLRVEGSLSKAQNINAALAHARGRVIAIYDADHLPEPHCFQKAWRWLADGYDVVQGRCVIRNYADSWFTRLIAIEFESIYAVSHPGRSLLTDTAIFGGSNGYWRAEVLRAIRLDPAMLTEDIDSSVRALIAGYRLLHDRSIVSEELAPTRFTDWWFQRQRWAQGWFEVTLKHQDRLLSSPHFNARQTLMWFYMFLWREVYPALSLQALPLVLAALLLNARIGWVSNWYFTLTTAVTLLSAPVITWITYQRTLWRARDQLRWWYPLYAGLNPLYVVLKNWVALVAQYRHLVGANEWVSTPRRRGRAGARPVAHPSLAAPGD